jgi:hypothetical protein
MFREDAPLIAALIVNQIVVGLISSHVFAVPAHI